MKRILITAAFLLPLLLVSCSDDKKGGVKPGGESSTLEGSYISIENGTFVNAEMPEPTINEPLQGVELSDQVMNGATNFITVTTDQVVKKFFLGITDVEGYIEYIPQNVRSTNTYVIPLMMAQDYSGDCELVISGELEGGAVTMPGYFPLFQVETRSGALDIKLAFSNEKDIDLHVFTPSGIHICYWSSRNGYYYGELPDNWWDNVDGSDMNEDGFYGFEFGLDIDSNAGCNIDGINKENVYIPERFLENGQYKIAVDLFENCDYSIATSWSVTTRMNGQLVRATSGANPAYGVFEIGAESSYEEHLVNVMTFTVSGVRSEASSEWPKVRLTNEMLNLNSADFFKREFAKAHRK